MLSINNPGNIRNNASIKYLGEIQPSKNASFKQFETIAYGYRAMFRDLNAKIQAGTNTISKIIYKYAPPEDNNDTVAYINTVCSMTGINKDTVLTYSDQRLIKIVAAMSKVENGVLAVLSDVQKGFEMIPLKKKL
ncbi:MAG: structural protein P5 [Bacteroidales bacterium]